MRTTNNNKAIRNIWDRFLSLVTNSDNAVRNENLTEIVTKEIDDLWTMVREKKTGAISETECRDRITESFGKLKDMYSDEQIDGAYVWPRYVKIAVHCVNEPINELVYYVKEKNYICLTKCLTNLYFSICKSEDYSIKQRMDSFAETVYLHILDDIDANDVPSLLELGRMAQRRGEYNEARMWYTRITETEQPFNGVTAHLACCEAEIKSYLSNCRGDYYSEKNQCARERIKTLNRLQHDIYEKWCRIMEENICQSDLVTDQNKREYVALMTGYARFERTRGHYSKAFDILGKIPEDYPDAYRVYAEQAMLYQFKPYQNCYYSLEKSIEAFKRAEEAMINKSSSKHISAKSKKSVLMPLANAYFQTGRYEEADKVCDSVLRIDEKEQKAINLKKRIANMAA